MRLLIEWAKKKLRKSSQVTFKLALKADTAALRYLSFLIISIMLILKLGGGEELMKLIGGMWAI